MKCKYSKSIEAYHEGHLSNGDHTEMSKHLKTCDECRQHLGELEYGDQWLAQLKSYKPKLENPVALRNAVLSNIKPRRQHVLKHEILHMLDVVIGLLVQPATRYAFFTAAIVFFGLFVYQQSSIVQKIDSLEKRLESKMNNEDSRPANRSSIEVLLKRELEGKHQNKDFDELLQDYSQLKIRYSLLIRTLKEKYPDTYKELVEEMDEELITNPNINI
jgi:hypothetical protein